MDRSLKWRTIALVAGVAFCVCILLPSFVSKDSLPTWFANCPPGDFCLVKSKINYGLDLQGGKHIVYNIALDKAVDDKASDIKRNLDSQFSDEKIAAVVKTPAAPLGAVTVLLTDKSKKGQVDDEIKKEFAGDVTVRDCPPEDGPGALCYTVSESFADNVKKAALTNAVATIRDRINEKGVAEPSVVEKGDDIIVELPGDPKSQAVVETEELIARTAKLEMKVIDDCSNPAPQGCTKDGKHDGAPFMMKLYNFVKPDSKDRPTEPEAIRLGVQADIDQWVPEEGGSRHTDYFLKAYDRDEVMPVECAKQKGKLTPESVVVEGKVHVTVTGREIIERYVGIPIDRSDKTFADKCLGYKGLAQKDPSFTVPDDHQLGFELVEPQPDAKDQRSFWRTYYLERTVRLTGSSISNAFGSYDPNTNRPVVLLDFNRYGGKVFGDVTSEIVGMKFATILDDKVKSAPIINTAITGGRAQITMGGSDPTHQEKERDDLVAVLKTGSLPAPLEKSTESDVGPTLGRDAIQKTKMSFIIGIGLVVLIMVGIYKWSGMIAVFAVVFHILMTLAVMAIFGATLTLPGIAAIVLSIGMEVDGNILIYERIRDELLLGKSVRGAIDLGFSRAFSAILDGQLTTAAAGWVLLQYGSGPIKGFAVMLLVGVFTTLTTNIWVTRILFDWEVSRKKGQLATLSI